MTPSCDRIDPSPSSQVIAAGGLEEAMAECETHLAKLLELNAALAKADLRKKSVMSEYFYQLDNWFKERLITRAKLNARGGVFGQADDLDVKTLNSLAKFYADARVLLRDNPDSLLKVEDALRKYGYRRRVMRRIDSEQSIDD